MSEPDEFDESSALLVAESLRKVLKRRTHKKKYLGQLYELPGRLDEALNLPKIQAKLTSKVAKRRQQGAAELNELWITLSAATQAQVYEDLEWYDPKSLDWEDKRSNRQPKIGSD